MTKKTLTHGRLVLLVGGDATTARACARAVCLPVIRARRVGVAADHVRSLHPVALVVAPEITQEDAAELERLVDPRVRVLHVDAGGDVDADDLRRAVGQR